MAYTIDKLRPQVMMFTMLAGGLVMMLPLNIQKTAKEVLDVVNGLNQKDWFLELVCYLINTFEDGKVTKEEFLDALQHFTDKVKANNDAPTIFQK